MGHSVIVMSTLSTTVFLRACMTSNGGYFHGTLSVAVYCVVTDLDNSDLAAHHISSLFSFLLCDEEWDPHLAASSLQNNLHHANMQMTMLATIIL